MSYRSEEEEDDDKLEEVDDDKFEEEDDDKLEDKTDEWRVLPTLESCDDDDDQRDRFVAMEGCDPLCLQDQEEGPSQP